MNAWSISLPAQSSPGKASLVLEGKELRERTLRWEKQRAEDEEKKRIEKELERRQEKELLDFKAILKDASRLHQATVIRNYIDKVEAHAGENNSLTDELKIGWHGHVKKLIGMIHRLKVRMNY